MLSNAANGKHVGEEKQAYRKATRKSKWDEPGGPI